MHYLGVILNTFTPVTNIPPFVLQVLQTAWVVGVTTVLIHLNSLPP